MMLNGQIRVGCHRRGSVHRGREPRGREGGRASARHRTGPRAACANLIACAAVAHPHPFAIDARPARAAPPPTPARRPEEDRRPASPRARRRSRLVRPVSCRAAAPRRRDPSARRAGGSSARFVVVGQAWGVRPLGCAGMPRRRRQRCRTASRRSRSSWPLPSMPGAEGDRRWPANQPGLNYVSYGLIAREVERVDSGYRSMMSVQSSLVMVPINEFGNEATKQKYLPKLATGEWIGCFGLTEPNHGSDPGSMITRAQKVDGGYAVGQQDVDHQQPDRRRVRGLGQGRRRRHPRLRAREGHEGPWRPRHPRQGGPARQITGEIVMDDVFCPRRTPSRVSRPEGPVHLPEQRALRHRLGRAGRAEDCWHARAPVRAGPQAVRPPAGGQPADPEEAGRHAETEITLGLQGCLRLGRMKDEGTPGGDHLDHEAQQLRQGAGHRRAWRDMMGGNGISDEFGVARHLVNLEVVNTYEGPSAASSVPAPARRARARTAPGSCPRWSRPAALAPPRRGCTASRPGSTAARRRPVRREPGRMFFGESMFSHRTDASKIALAALVCLLPPQHGVAMIDCQQRTRHLPRWRARAAARRVRAPPTCPGAPPGPDWT